MSPGPVHLRERLPDAFSPGRPIAEQLALYAPGMVHAGFAALSRLPPGSPVRRRLVASVVSRFTRTMNRGDFDTALMLAFEPDVEIRVVGFAIGMPDEYRGHQGMRDFFDDWREAMGWPWFTIDRLVDMGDPLLIGLSFTSRGRSSGVSASKAGLGFVVSLSQRGLVRRWEMYWDWEEAVRAARAAAHARVEAGG